MALLHVYTLPCRPWDGRAHEVVCGCDELHAALEGLSRRGKWSVLGGEGMLRYGTDKPFLGRIGV